MSKDNIEDCDIKSMLKDIRSRQFSTEEMEASINKCLDTKLDEINKRITSVESQVNDNHNRILDLETNIDAMKDQLVKSESVLDNTRTMTMASLEQANKLEQYSRKSSVFIFNLNQSSSDESMLDCRKLVSAMINEHLKIDIHPSKISVAHRLPKRKGFKGPPPMYVRFLHIEDKISVMKAARGINRDESKPSIKHDLTDKNKKLISAIYDHDKFKSGWYYNGNIFALTDDNYKIGPLGIFVNLSELYTKRKEIGQFLPPKDNADNSEKESDYPALASTAPKELSYTDTAARRRGGGKARGARGDGYRRSDRISGYSISYK